VHVRRQLAEAGDRHLLQVLDPGAVLVDEDEDELRAGHPFEVGVLEQRPQGDDR
jgi:hypothetical protein